MGHESTHYLLSFCRPSKLGSCTICKGGGVWNLSHKFHLYLIGYFKSQQANKTAHYILLSNVKFHIILNWVQILKKASDTNLRDNRESFFSLSPLSILQIQLTLLVASICTHSKTHLNFTPTPSQMALFLQGNDFCWVCHFKIAERVEERDKEKKQDLSPTRICDQNLNFFFNWICRWENIGSYKYEFMYTLKYLFLNLKTQYIWLI